MTRQVVSFSGGRTSAYLVMKIVAKYRDVLVVFMDTGCEHPATYKFIRDIVEFWGVEVVCIRMRIAATLRGRNSFYRVPVADLKWDTRYMKALIAKLGTSTARQPHCTRDLKRRTFEKFIKKEIPDGDYVAWLGIRYDEPKRLWGAHAFKELRDRGLSLDDCAQLWADIANGADVGEYGSDKITKRLEEVKRDKLRYLAELSDFEKDDVIAWWKKQPFDLGIEEHLGNCVFCVKKNAKKIALAIRDEPELAKEWRAMHIGDHVRTEGLPSRDPAKSAYIYRDSATGHQTTMDNIIAMFEPYTRDELYQQMKFSGGEDTGNCSESCEAFN